MAGRSRQLDNDRPGDGIIGRQSRERTSVIVPIFIISFLLPVFFFLGPLRLSPYRVVLLVLFIPLVFTWLSGGMGKIRTPDVLILLSALWSGVALLVNNGIERAFEPAGILLIETFGSYLIARRYIRNVSNFIAMVRTLFWVIVILFPFAIYETLTGNAIILEVLSKVTQTFPQNFSEPRLGLERVQVVFEHPILFGVFISSAFALVYYVIGFRQNAFLKFFKTGIVIISTLLSLSTGAYVALIIQQFFISWNYFMRRFAKRWSILGSLFLFAYFVVDILSNRTPFHVFVTYLTFNMASSYNRIIIWNFGTAEVARNPIFGIGLNDWIRPLWMSASMDNFWLVIAVFYGLPAFLLFAGAVLIIMRNVGRANLQSDMIKACRQGFLISLGGLVIAGVTVHYWNAIYCWFIFLVGSGVWMLDHDELSETKNSRHLDNRKPTPKNY